MKKLGIWCTKNEKLLKEIRKSHCFVLSILLLSSILLGMIVGLFQSL